MEDNREILEQFVNQFFLLLKEQYLYQKGKKRKGTKIEVYKKTHGKYEHF